MNIVSSLSHFSRLPPTDSKCAQINILAMQKPFHLLKLPSIAIEEVLKQIDRVELIDLAQCSKRSAHFVRLEALHRYKLTLDFGIKHVELGKFKIYAWNLPPGRDALIQMKTFGSCTVPCRVETMLMETYWRDRKQGLETLVLFLARLFRMKISQFFSDSQDLARFHSVMKFLLEWQKDIERLNINVEITEENLSRIMTELKITGELWISSQLAINSSFQFPNYPSMLRLDSSSWFTLDHLLAAQDCVRIALVESSLTNKDLDVFVGKWKTGEYPKLECLDVTGDRLDGQTMIVGLAPPIVNIHNQKQETKLLGTYYAARITNAVDIHRDTDKIRASLHMDSTKKPIRFQMIAWI